VSDAESQGVIDKKASGILLQAAEEKTREVLNSGQYRDKSREIMTLIQQTRDLLDNIKHVTASRVYADLSAKGGSNNLGLIAGRDRYYVYDSEKLFEVILDKVQDPIKFESNETIISGSYFDLQDQPIFFSKSGKLYAYASGVLREMVAQEGAMRKGVQITDWGNRVYILDPASDQIWKYPFVKSTSVFGSAEGYKTDGKLDDAISFTIDANVFVLASDGGIDRYYGGVKQSTQIEKAPFTPLAKPTKIYTDSEMNQLFVIDGNRIFAYVKDLKTENLVYSHQFVVSGISDIRDIHYDKNTEKFYLLDASKIYEMVP
jgi:sugar lactone lactonase YvrE